MPNPTMRTVYRRMRPSKKFLAHIGEATINLNRLQQAMDHFIWDVLKLDSDTGTALTGPFRFNGRIDMVQSLGNFYFSSKSKYAHKQFKEILKSIRDSYGRRNDLEHSWIMGGTERSSGVLIRFKAGKLELMLDKEVKKIARDLLECAIALHNLRFRHFPRPTDGSEEGKN